MSIKFQDANIVLLAETQHNLAILNVEWLKANNLITETPIHNVNTPGVFIFGSENYRIVGNEERIQIITIKELEENLQTIANVIKEYVLAAGNLLYLALGLNFNFNIEKNNNENLPQINLQIGNNKIFEELSSNSEIEYGGIVRSENEDYTLKIVIEPKRENMLNYSFNYHFVLIAVSKEEIADRITLFYDLFLSAKELVIATLSK